MGAAYANLGEIDRGERLADEGLAIALEHNALAIPIAKAAQAEIFLLAGRLDDAEAAIAESVLDAAPRIAALRRRRQRQDPDGPDRSDQGRPCRCGRDRRAGGRVAPAARGPPLQPGRVPVEGLIADGTGQARRGGARVARGKRRGRAARLRPDPVADRDGAEPRRVCDRRRGASGRAPEPGQRHRRSDRRKHRRRPNSDRASSVSRKSATCLDSCVRLTGGSRVHGPHRSRHRVQAAGAHRFRRFARRRDHRVRAARGPRRHVRRPPVEGPNRRRTPRAPHVREGG